MNLSTLLSRFENCPCGRLHTADLKAIEISHGCKDHVASILSENGFPKRILAVADRNTLAASGDILERLASGGFHVTQKLYENFREPLAAFVDEIVSLSADVDGILSIGSGSLNDICRRAALLANKEFAIFATAPSMDGFASGTAPIIENGVKSTMPARQPSIIIGDTEILAAAPTELKAAGFGDIIGKYIALVDWRVAHLLVGEYYCEAIAELVREALRRITALAAKVNEQSEEAAGAIMETLVLTGIAMKLADSSRPASGAEHMISPHLGMRKLDEGKIADFHGKKVGVATVTLSRLYHNFAARERIRVRPESVDWDAVYNAYGAESRAYIREMNAPTITEDIPPERFEESLDQIRAIIREELPSHEKLLAVMHRAHAATTYAEIDVDRDLAKDALLYHGFMRHKVVLSRMLFLTDLDLIKEAEI